MFSDIICLRLSMFFKIATSYSSVYPFSIKNTSKLAAQNLLFSLLLVLFQTSFSNLLHNPFYFLHIRLNKYFQYVIGGHFRSIRIMKTIIQFLFLHSGAPTSLFSLSITMKMSIEIDLNYHLFIITLTLAADKGIYKDCQCQSVFLPMFSFILLLTQLLTSIVAQSAS